MIRGVIILSVVACCLGAPHRIVNGTDAEDGEFPFVVTLQYASGIIYGAATILNENWIMTAATVLAGQKPKNVMIGYGSNYYQPNTTIQLAEIIVHPNFNWYLGFGDIAVARLASPIPFSEIAAPAVLPQQDEPTQNGTVATVVGWGYNGTINAQAYLQKADLFIVDIDTCQNWFTRDKIYESNLCAGVPGGWRGQCTYDIGGPLVIDGTQVGIVSWFEPCGTPEPGVYIRVSYYRDWIKQKTGV